MHTSYQVLRLNTTPKNWEANPNCIQLFLAFLTNFDHMVAWSCHGSKITKKLVGKASNHWHAKSGNPLFSFYLFYSFQNYLLKGTWSHHGSYSPVTYLKVTWSPEAAMDHFYCIFSCWGANCPKLIRLQIFSQSPTLNPNFSFQEGRVGWVCFKNWEVYHLKYKDLSHKSNTASRKLKHQSKWFKSKWKIFSLSHFASQNLLTNGYKIATPTR